MLFSVCIPTVRPNTIASAIRSVRSQTVGDWELIVVGQGDAAALRPAVEQAAEGDERVRYLHSSVRGASVARNAAIANSRGEVVAFLDDDCEAQRDWLEVLGERFGSDPDIGFVIGALVRPETTDRRVFKVCPQFIPPEDVYDPVSADRVAPSTWGFASGNFAVKRTVAGRVGPFDESLGAGTAFGGAEDTDYLLRLELLGVRMAATPRAVVNHTFGWRHGIGAVYSHKRNYARGDGALVAKLELLGDARGREWTRHNIRVATVDRLRALRFHEIPGGLFRLIYFLDGRRKCLRGFAVHSDGEPVDPVTAVLSPVRREG
jgi:glycosyltransferase involved in cell wall biosynthesis